METVDKELLKAITDKEEYIGAYNIRKNGQGIKRNVTDNIDIVTKDDNSGIDVFVKDNTKFDVVNLKK